MLIGLDIGYGYTKAVTAHQTVVFPSAVGTAEEVHFAFHAAPEPFHFQGLDYFVGKPAIRQSRVLFSDVADASWIETDAYLVLAAYALHLLGSPEPAQVTLVTGLPLAQATPAAKSRVIERLRVLADKVTVVPQAFGALFDTLLDDAGRLRPERSSLTEGRIGVVDFGYYTTDFAVVDALEEVSEASGSINLGVRAVHQAFARAIDEKYHRSVDLLTFERVLDTGHLWVYDQLKPVQALLDKARAAVAAGLEARLRSAWGGGTELQAVLLAGGGVRLFGDTLRPLFPHLIILEQAVLANARGFYKRGLLQARRGA